MLDALQNLLQADTRRTSEGHPDAAVSQPEAAECTICLRSYVGFSTARTALRGILDDQSSSGLSLLSRRPHLCYPCGHTMCKGCLDDWQESQKLLVRRHRRNRPASLAGKCTCPICRQPIEGRALNRALCRVVDSLAACTEREQAIPARVTKRVTDSGAQADQHECVVSADGADADNDTGVTPSSCVIEVGAPRGSPYSRVEHTDASPRVRTLSRPSALPFMLPPPQPHTSVVVPTAPLVAVGASQTPHGTRASYGTISIRPTRPLIVGTTVHSDHESADYDTALPRVERSMGRYGQECETKSETKALGSVLVVLWLAIFTFCLMTGLFSVCPA